MGFASFDQITPEREPVAGIIVLGSAASVNDPFPWNKKLEQWLALHISADIPILGICYGHQLIGKMFGAPVNFMHANHFKMKGLRTTRLMPIGCFENLPLEGELVVSHAESVLDIPREFEILASSPEVAIDGLAHRNKPIWSFQSHPESTRGFLVNQEIDPDLTMPHLGFGHAIVQRFLSFCAQRNPQS